MKTAAKKSFVIFSLSVLLTFGMSMNSFASDVAEHHHLAMYFEKLAQNMQAKIDEQKDIVNHKPSSSYFGKNGRNIKSHVAYKIHKYEQAAAEYQEQAAYHHAIAEQATMKSIAKTNPMGDKKDSSL
ncbi:MAG: hypothetical protein H0V39_08065 [Nitrosomonas sp.]|nr:hypothetical protein [Nitrosomonas sp.]